MTVNINITGTLELDQTVGIQADDVDVTNILGVLGGGLDDDFELFLNGLGLSAAQKDFAASVEGASDPDFVSVTADAGETIGKLFFSDASGNDFDGDAAIFNGNPITTIDGQALFLYSEMNGKVVLAKTAGGFVAAAFYIEGANGNTTATVQSITFVALAHPDPNNPNDPVDFSGLLNVSAVISKPAPVVVTDDAPTIVTSGQEDSLAVDETDLGTDASGSFAGAFTPDFGSDGSGSLTYALGIKSPGADSGLVDTDTGDRILLRLDVDGNVEGYLENDPSTVAFEITLDEASGATTLDQLRAVAHPDALDPDDDVTLASDDLITVTATITDADGDQDEAVIDVGQNYTFGDDGPSITTTGSAPDLTVDESDLTVNASGSVASAFTPVGGADGEDSTVYALNLGANASGVDSGLDDTATGDSILLRVANGDVEGYLENDPATVAFRVSLDELTGAIGLDQLRAVVHPDATDPDDDVKLFGSDLIVVTATITDGDGDQASSDLDVTQALTFGDDGPFIDPDDDAINVVVDETVLATDTTVDFSTQFTSGAGADGDGIVYALSVDGFAGTDSGLDDTATGDSILLRVIGGGTSIEGYLENDDTVLAFVISVDADGKVTLDQRRAIVHADATDPDDPASFADGLIKLTATITDGDGDQDSATLDIGSNLVFEDDGPTAPTVGTRNNVEEDESAGVNILADPNAANDVSGFPTAVQTRFDALALIALSFAAGALPLVNLTGGAFGADGPAASDATDFLLSVVDGTDSGLDTDAGTSIFLFNGPGDLVLGRVGNDPAGAIAFAMTVGDDGTGYLASYIAIKHGTAGSGLPGIAAFDEVANVTNAAIQLTVTLTDGDGDQATTGPINVGDAFRFQDDGPAVTAAFDADPGTAGIQTPEHLGNQAGQTASGTFGYDIGSDNHTNAEYTAGASDFVDQSAAAGIQIGLTGFVGAAPGSAITGASVVRTAESLTSASFDWSFHYDKDPLTAGVQDATAGGTLTFDKVNDTYSLTVNDVVDGFSFDVLHTSELLRKAPPGNTGHPELVVTELDLNNGTTDTDGFYVQFTANSNPAGSPFGFNATGDGSPIAGDTTFNAGQQISTSFEDWVSATQSTNGVAGDTIQKGELLTLRFFNENIMGDVNPGAPGGGTEKVTPTDSVSGIALKFDGIGNSEDLIMVLNLIDKNGADNIAGTADDNSTTTKSMFIQNGDFYKLSNGGVPSPYNTEFTLDNNDGLVIIESNDYNAAGQDYEIQGVQIMQSGNGLTGQAIDLNKALGAAGGSTTAALQAWEAQDNDVLKIVDIGFIENTSGTLPASLDFNFQLADADGDTTLLQHLPVLISNDFIV